MLVESYSDKVSRMIREGARREYKGIVQLGSKLPSATFPDDTLYLVKIKEELTELEWYTVDTFICEFMRDNNCWRTYLAGASIFEIPAEYVDRWQVISWD